MRENSGTGISYEEAELMTIETSESFHSRMERYDRNVELVYVALSSAVRGIDFDLGFVGVTTNTSPLRQHTPPPRGPPPLADRASEVPTDSADERVFVRHQLPSRSPRHSLRRRPGCPPLARQHELQYRRAPLGGAHRCARTDQMTLRSSVGSRATGTATSNAPSKFTATPRSQYRRPPFGSVSVTYRSRDQIRSPLPRFTAGWTWSARTRTGRPRSHR